MVALGALVHGLRRGVGEVEKRATTVLPLWLLIVIVIAGTGLLALFLGLCFLGVCRRRRGDMSGKILMLNGISDRGSDGGSNISHDERGRGKLRKQQRLNGTTDDDGIDDVDGEGEIGFREISPVRKVSMLVMPDIFGRRGSLNPFAGVGGFNISSNNAKRGSGGNQGIGFRKRMSNAWIDEDTLHGPKMTSAAMAEQPPSSSSGSSRKARKRSWRMSLRESWPLKTLSPTLPRLPHFDGRQGMAVGGRHDSLSMFQYKNYTDQAAPELEPPLGLVARQYERQVSPPRPLPQPPMPALLASNRASAGGNRSSGWTGARSIGEIVPRDRGLSYYKYEDTNEPVKSTNSLCTKPGGGVGIDTGVALGSTLSIILKDTEMRLQEGATTGVARRNRFSTSPPKRAAVPGPDASTATLVGSGPRTPSPTKPEMPLSDSAGAASAHTRQTSDASVLSEADSMVGDGSPGLLYHGLTSPSRSKPQPQPQQISPHRRKLSRAASFTSSVASSLSDISEENSMVSGTTPNTTAPNSSIPADMNKIAGFASDPFTVMDEDTPAGNRAVPRNRGVYPASRGTHGTLERQRGRQTSNETLFTISQSPLSLISGNSRSPEPSPTRMPERVNKTKAPQNQRSHPAAIHLPAPDSRDSPSDSIHKRTSPGQTTPAGISIPNLSLTSPSNDGDSPSPRRTGAHRRLESPPNLIYGLQSQDREQSPDMVPPSSALPNTRLSSVYDCYAEMNNDHPSSSTSVTRRRAAGEVRKISDDTTSSYYSDQGTYEKEKAAALNELNVLLNQDFRTGQPRATVRIVPPELGIRDNQNLQVSSTIAELRRMNSQVSAYSAAASGYSDDSAATVRPEVVRPPRKGAAARNYLALGSPPKVSDPRGQHHHDKENDRVGVKMARVDEDDNGTGRQGGVAVTPVRNRWYEKVQIQQMEDGRRSEESLGLYDEDGFLISPERRLGLRT
ncbi:hypothetical protein VM1G_07294 [Cytospora mali]|uniref:Uncharacterized protein n=1 Tax=Cytospora mali TaxID=578113 RepID=A0A194W601_CYTMA|nr:hypothetical protein VM1G_07294 [Valsa mali]